MNIAELVTRAIVFLVAMDVHEFAHAYVAYLNGDPTAKSLGRMTLDPRANINPLGYMMGVLFGFGWLGSAPVVASRMRNPRLGMFLAVAAGPFSNLLIAALFAMPIRLGLIPIESLLQASQNPLLPSIGELLYAMVYLNVLLFVFNLIPLYPLDGWTVVLAALPTVPAVWWQRNQQISMYIFYALIVLSLLASYLGPLGRYNPLGIVVAAPTQIITSALLGF